MSMQGLLTDDWAEAVVVGLASVLEVGLQTQDEEILGLGERGVLGGNNR